MPGETKPIFPLVNRLMRLIEGSRCVAGEESVVELAFWEALNNAVVRGNRLDAHKLFRLFAAVPRSIWLMRDAMDEVSFECGGTKST